MQIRLVSGCEMQHSININVWNFNPVQWNQRNCLGSFESANWHNFISFVQNVIKKLDMISWKTIFMIPIIPFFFIAILKICFWICKRSLMRTLAGNAAETLEGCWLGWKGYIDNFPFMQSITLINIIICGKNNSAWWSETALTEPFHIDDIDKWGYRLENETKGKTVNKTHYRWLFFLFVKEWKCAGKGWGCQQKMQKDGHYNSFQGRSRAAIWQLQETISSGKTLQGQSCQSGRGEDNYDTPPFEQYQKLCFNFIAVIPEKWITSKISKSIWQLIINDFVGAQLG